MNSAIDKQMKRTVRIDSEIYPLAAKFPENIAVTIPEAIAP